MSTYVLIHGAGDVGWYRHLVETELRGRRHDVVAVDLPVDDEAATLADYADTVVAAVGDRTDLVVVAQSAGGYTAPIVCGRVPARLLVLVAPMIPAPGETATEMLANTGYTPPTRAGWSDLAIFYRRSWRGKRCPGRAGSRKRRGASRGGLTRGRTCRCAS